MRGLLEKLLGVDLSGLDEGARAHLEWSRAPSSGDLTLLLIVVVSALLVGVGFLYRKDAVGQRPARRWTLTALRCGIVLGLLVVFLEPRLVITRTDEVPSNLIVLRDVSASMDLTDSVDDPDRAARTLLRVGLSSPSELSTTTRSQLADRIFDRGLFAALAHGGDRVVAVHPFADRFFLEPKAALDPNGAFRQYTSVGSSLEQALAAFQGPPLAGVLLVSDGRSNSGADPLRAAETLAAANVRVNVLAMGEDRPSRDASLARIDAPEVVFVRDPIEMDAIVVARGYGDAAGSLSVERRVDGGAWEEIGRYEVDFANEGEIARVRFADTFERPGEVEYRSALDPMPGDVDPSNDRTTTKVRVVRPEMRVLLVAGLAFPEVQFLINTLMRDPGIVLSSWLQHADPDYPQKGEKVLTRLPISAEELAEYHCIVLYDPDLSELPPNFTSLLLSFVGQEAGGLVFVTGESATASVFDRKAPGSEDLLTLIPVIRDAGSFRTRIEERLNLGLEWRMALTTEGADDTIFRFDADPTKNERILKNLPPFYWHFAVDRAKPGAVVLARHGDPRMTNQHGAHVVVATQLYGPGRTFFLGLDSTYRWRFLGEALFDGFWARVVDRAGKAKLLGGRLPLQIGTDASRYPPGSMVTVTARFRDGRDRPGDLQVLAAELESPDDGVVPLLLTPSPTDPGAFEAQVRVTSVGDHHLRVWPTETPQESARAATSIFRVAPPDQELLLPAADLPTLESVARITRGRVFRPHQWDEIDAAFPIRRVALTRRTTNELWNAPLVLGSVLLLLCAEWILRKRFQLV